jgi:hypothetical protein
MHAFLLPIVGLGSIAVIILDAAGSYASRIPHASPRRIPKIALLVTVYGALCGGIAAAVVLMFEKRLP